ncbi:DUF3137 domain-containing protein [Oceanicaulis sp. LC35]|uniref:DUF3137 domain-containing protein n=1 Tax=Oceanicaulis sp. LC35 TaxID=3349635 RepID=UPI003F827E9C
MRDLTQAIAELTPWLEGLESERKSAVAQSYKGLALGAAGAAAWVLVCYAASWPVPVMFVGGVVIFIGLMAWGSHRLNKLRKTVKAGLNDRFAEAFGMRYRAEVHNPIRFDAFREHDLVPTSDRKSFEDLFSGEVHGADFDLYEAHLEQRRRTKNRTYYVTVFRGVLIRINFPRTVEGVTLVKRDAGMFNALEGWAKKTFSGKKLERVGLVDPTFEKAFEVYGTDQVMARYLLTPSFMERLLKLESVLKGKNVRCVFDENLGEGAGRGELLIVAETGNKFEAGSMFKPLTDQSRIATLHGEFSMIDDIIHTVLEPASEGGGVSPQA